MQWALVRHFAGWNGSIWPMLCIGEMPEHLVCNRVFQILGEFWVTLGCLVGSAIRLVGVREGFQWQGRRSLPASEATVGQTRARQWHWSPWGEVKRPTFRQAGFGHCMQMSAGCNSLVNGLLDVRGQ